MKKIMLGDDSHVASSYRFISLNVYRIKTITKAIKKWKKSTFLLAVS
jgi:hypothetical protein